MISKFFIAGSDEAAVKKAAVALAAQLAPGADAFGLEMIDGAVDTVDAAVSKIHDTCQALQTMPFLGGTKLIWLKSASFLSNTVTGNSESVLSALEGLCEILKQPMPDGVSFLMSVIDPYKVRTAYKNLTKLCKTVLHDKPTLGFGSGEEEIISWTASKAHDRGLKISHEAIETLAARIGLDSGQLENELDKMETAFGPGHPIDVRDVRSLVPATRESGIFDIGNAIASRDIGLALDTLSQLLRQRESGIGILLASIVPTVRNLLLIKDLLVRHHLQPPAQPQFFASMLNRLKPAEIEHLPRKKDGTLNSYPLGIAARNSVHYTTAELFRAFQGCAGANLQLVTSQGSEEVVLTRLLTGFMSR
ncbi:MAG: DNA polymerase III subunit delta [Verrucomicrobiae bacterium]